ncbi:group II intron reverse transcriptase/maturase [Salinispora pacifica]|uniref:group II intron reverse transcriptase/maturase n=1 Tax=Salinispora pacifica TaxID=351187 RepID=UPI0004840277|nr:group II intron reverse transcriptase/maturase [Salinispora pacifica]
MKLELSQSKTLITHAASQAARFLGYEIRTQRADNKLDRRGQRSVNAAIGLFVPRDVIRQKCVNYMREGKPAQRGSLLHDQDFTIIAKYQAEYRGLVQYYLLAQDVFRLDTLRWVMETSMLKTLAGKHKSTVTKMARKYKTVIETHDGNEPVSRSPSIGTGAGNHWSPASAGSRSNANAQPSLPTCHRSWPAQSETS